MKDATATMGQILPDDVTGRDAVHVAVIQCVADEKLAPGQDVGLVTGTAASSKAGQHIGIVDPFLKGMVWPGQRFWLFLYPRTITSLKHQWTHPAFEEVDATYAPPSKKLASEQWLKDFCEDNNCPSYVQTLALAESFMDGHDPGDGEYLLSVGQDAHGQIPAEFWTHVENILGRKMPDHIEARPTFFSCTC